MTTTTRRAMLAGAAALPALAAVPAFAATTAAPDPIFAALDAFRRTWDETERWCGPVDLPDDVMRPWYEAKVALLATRPTTPAGLAALTECVSAEWQTRMRLNLNGHMWLDEELETLSATIAEATRGMAGLAPWSPPASTATGADPIFDAISAHVRAMAAYDAAVDVSGNLRDDTPEYAMADAITQREGDALDNAGIDLIETYPTTMAGLGAVLAHIAECIKDSESTWRLPERLEPDGKGSFVQSCEFEARSLSYYVMLFAVDAIGRLATGRV